MTEVPPGSPQFDFARPFSYVFDDPRWPQKIGIGGLFYFLSFVVVGWFFILGYMAETVRNVIAGAARPLPEWDDLRGFFDEGLRLAGVVLVWFAPVLLIAAVIAIPAIALDAVQDQITGPVELLVLVLMACFGCLIVPLWLAWLFLVPVSLLFAIVDRRFGAAFELGRIFRFIRGNAGNYLFAVLVMIIAHFIGGMGFGVLCIGLLFTAFWSQLIIAHAFGQLYRAAAK
jgi:hypothetical protein